MQPIAIERARPCTCPRRVTVLTTRGLERQPPRVVETGSGPCADRCSRETAMGASTCPFATQTRWAGWTENMTDAASRSVSRVLYAPRERGAWRPSIYGTRRHVPPAVYPQTRAGRPQASARTGLCPALLDLAPGGVYRAAHVTVGAGALLPHRFTLTAADLGPGGGLFSVALSRGSPRVGVTNHPALWSPDFPRTRRSPGRLAAARPTRRVGKCNVRGGGDAHRRSFRHDGVSRRGARARIRPGGRGPAGSAGRRRRGVLGRRRPLRASG